MSYQYRCGSHSRLKCWRKCEGENLFERTFLRSLQRRIRGEGRLHQGSAVHGEGRKERYVPLRPFSKEVKTPRALDCRAPNASECRVPTKGKQPRQERGGWRGRVQWKLRCNPSWISCSRLLSASYEITRFPFSSLITSTESRHGVY